MTVENDFLVWAPGGGANVPTQAAYAASSVLPLGVQTGVASSQLYNKTARQSSVFSSTWAQFIIAQTGQPVIDDGTTATILANVTQTLLNIGATNGGYPNFQIGAATLTTNQSGFIQLKDPTSGPATYTTTLPSPTSLFIPETQPTPVYTIWNQSSTAQTLYTPAANFNGPAGSNGSALTLNAGDCYYIWSDNLNWICTKIGSRQQQAGGHGMANYVGGAFSFTVPLGVTEIDVIMTGGGAAGGAASTATFGSTTAAGGGGGAGGTARFKVAVTPGSVLTGNVGLGGVGVNAVGASGNNGGDTTFLGVTAQGGVGGGAFVGTSPGGGEGFVSGSPTGLLGAMAAIPGGMGQDGQLGSLFCGGMGGSSFWGGGSRAAAGSTGYNASAYGAGGGGVYATTDVTPGGSGAGGVVEISW